MEAKAFLKFTRTAPQKVRLVTGLIAKKKVSAAIDQLSASTKKTAPIVLKVLKSAISNAKNNKKMDIDNLVVLEAFVDEGATLKRWRPRAFGRAAAIRKRTSKITVVVGDLKEKEEQSKKSGAPEGKDTVKEKKDSKK